MSESFKVLDLQINKVKMEIKVPKIKKLPRIANMMKFLTMTSLKIVNTKVDPPQDKSS